MAKNIRFGGDTWDKSVDKLPQDVKASVFDLFRKLQKAADGNGLNFESLHSEDKSFRSVRVNKKYRVILSKGADDYIFLYVGNHDDAYKWVEKKHLNVNNVSGELSLVEIKEVEEIVKKPVYKYCAEEAHSAPNSSPPFGNEKFSDADLRSLLPGLTDEMLTRLRAYPDGDRFSNDHDKLAKEMGSLGADVLFDLACGESIEAVREKYKLGENRKIPTSVDEALKDEACATQFPVIASEEDFQKALAYPLERWRIFLHPSQKVLVDKDHNGPFRVTGGAGTGKTVAAMHRAARLAKRLESSSAPGKVLFTTYTKNLAEDIKDNLSKICTSEQLKKIEVVNLDAFAARLLKFEGVNVKPIWKLDRADREKMWNDSLDARPRECALPNEMTPEEIRREWEQVVQGNDVLTLGDYLRASRSGRGVRLGKAQKKELWNVFEEYRSQLKRRDLVEAEDLYRTARELIGNKPDLVSQYVSVVVDEAQDFGNAAFKLLAAVVAHRHGMKNVMYITGDAHQRIYSRKVVLSRCGIDVRGRSRKLRINYRTTEETRVWASAVLKNCSVDDLDGATDDLKGYRSLMHGDKPQIISKDSEEEELKAIVDYIKEIQAGGNPLHGICVVVCSQKQVESFEKKLTEQGIPVHTLTPQQGGLKEGSVSVATMHRVKGLEFDYMILAGMSERNLDSMIEYSGGGEDGLLRMRSLVHVAATRARKHVLITASAPLPPWIGNC